MVNPRRESSNTVSPLHKGNDYLEQAKRKKKAHHCVDFSPKILWFNYPLGFPRRVDLSVGQHLF